MPNRLLSLARRRVRSYLDRLALRDLRHRSPRRIVVGAGGTRFPGWVSSNQEILDLLEEGDWARYLLPATLDAILAEHVWEHLTLSQAGVAARNCHRYLRSGGHLRIAVPDGFHPDPAYREYVKPGGVGPGSSDHKVLYSYLTLSELLTGAGFEVRLLEWFDEHGEFHHEPWDEADGFVLRSTRHDPRNRVNPTAYTSLIVDAVKP